MSLRIRFRLVVGAGTPGGSCSVPSEEDHRRAWLLSVPFRRRTCSRGLDAVCLTPAHNAAVFSFLTNTCVREALKENPDSRSLCAGQSSISRDVPEGAPLIPVTEETQGVCRVEMRTSRWVSFSNRAGRMWDGCKWAGIFFGRKSVRFLLLASFCKTWLGISLIQQRRDGRDLMRDNGCPGDFRGLTD